MSAERVPPDFRMTVENGAETVLVRLAGEFDLATIGGVEASLERALGGTTRHVVFDLRKVNFIDMAALMTLIRVNERARQAEFDVQVVAPTGLASRVFTLTRAGAELAMVERLPDSRR